MNQNRMEQECRAYAHYLIGQEPEEYVLEKYAFGCAEGGRIPAPSDRFNRFLIEISVRGPGWVRLADAYAGRFCKNSVLRKKLILTLALLECSRNSFDYLDGVEPGGLATALARLAGHALLYAGTLLLAILLFLPVQVWMAVFSRSGSGKIPVTES